MPKRPASKKQLAYVHAAAERGEGWAKETVEEWHGKDFGNFPKRAPKKRESRAHGTARVVRA